jgi:hypothetical protein
LSSQANQPASAVGPSWQRQAMGRIRPTIVQAFFPFSNFFSELKIPEVRVNFPNSYKFIGDSEKYKINFFGIIVSRYWQ